MTAYGHHCRQLYYKDTASLFNNKTMRQTNGCRNKKKAAIKLMATPQSNYENKLDYSSTFFTFEPMRA